MDIDNYIRNLQNKNTRKIITRIDLISEQSDNSSSPSKIQQTHLISLLLSEEHVVETLLLQSFNISAATINELFETGIKEIYLKDCKISGSNNFSETLDLFLSVDLKTSNKKNGILLKKLDTEELQKSTLSTEEDETIRPNQTPRSQPCKSRNESADAGVDSIEDADAKPSTPKNSPSADIAGLEQQGPAPPSLLK